MANEAVVAGRLTNDNPQPLPYICTASLTINENADPDVRTDMETALNHIVPEKWAENGACNEWMQELRLEL